MELRYETAYHLRCQLLLRSGRTITLKASIQLTKSLTIDGTNQNITISGNNNTQIFQMSSSSLTENINNIVFSGGHGSFGGAISATGGTLNLSGDTFSQNTAVWGGAVYWSDPTVANSFNVRGCRFSGNQAVTWAGIGGQGGAIYALPAPGAPRVILQGPMTTFTNNTAADSGGAVFMACIGGNTLQVANCQFNSNTATNGSGGAIATPNGSTGVSMVLSSSGFTLNKANSLGGAVYAVGTSGPTVEVTNTDFTSNQVTGSGDVNLPGSGNVYPYLGGAIYTTDSLTVNGGTYKGNSAAAGGGAIYYQMSQNTNVTLSLSNATFSNNTANRGGGSTSSATSARVATR